LIRLSLGHCRRVSKIKGDGGGNLSVQGVRHTPPKLVKQVFALAKQLSSCLNQALQAALILDADKARLQFAIVGQG